MSHNSWKTAPIFTTFIHSTSLDSLNKHMCCDLQRIARTHRTKNVASIPPRQLSRNYYIISHLAPGILEKSVFQTEGKLSTLV